MNENDDSAPQSDRPTSGPPLSEEQDARLARAAMKSLAVSAPADLKAELRRAWRTRPETQRLGPSIWDGLCQALSGGGAWAYGAGAALAAAAVAVVVLRAVPERPKTVETSVDVSAASALADLWADDDGKDDDES